MPINLTERSGDNAGTLYTNDALHLQLKGVALSVYEGSKLDIDLKYEPLFFDFFSRPMEDVGPKDFVRSAVVEVNTNTQNDDEDFKRALQLSLKVDIIKRNRKFAKQTKEVVLAELLLFGKV